MIKRGIIIGLFCFVYSFSYAQDTVIHHTYSINITKYTNDLNSIISPFNTIYFNADDYSLRQKYYKNLIEIINVLDDYPNAHIEIVGHANSYYYKPNTAHFKYVYQLSLQRALSVKAFLVENGIEAERIYIKACGGSELKYPYAANEFFEKYNRRVMIRIIS